MKSRTKKRFVTVLLCSMLVAAFMCPMVAYAGNWRDKPYYIQSTGDGFTWTPSEEKWDSTSSWNACNYASANHSAEIAAQWTENGTVFFVGSQIYCWSSGKADYMTNMIKETNASIPYATLWLTGPAWFQANGMWSPDSI
ncbi:MAG: hypothetical protein LBG81_02805 [Coriobacteriaceae bacterium]|nr:hypothetical protein [Coriobacteriaceae bacterium]